MAKRERYRDGRPASVTQKKTIAAPNPPAMASTTESTNVFVFLLRVAGSGTYRTSRTERCNDLRSELSAPRTNVAVRRLGIRNRPAEPSRRTLGNIAIVIAMPPLAMMRAASRSWIAREIAPVQP